MRCQPMPLPFSLTIGPSGALAAWCVPSASSRSRQAGHPCLCGRTNVHGPLISVTAGGSGDVSQLRLAEGHRAVPLTHFEGVSHRYIGRRKRLASEIRRARELPCHKPPSALEDSQCLTGAPVVALILRCEMARTEDEEKGRGEA